MTEGQMREMLMLRAAEMYYFEQMTQAAIADRLGTTRWTVGRMLEEARETGMVTISINHPHTRIRELECALKEKYGLRNAIVVLTQEDEESTTRLVVKAAADYLTCLRPRPRSLAVAWGQTMAALARVLPDPWNSGLQVYQTYGGLVRSNDDAVADSIGLMARRGRGTGHMVPAPAIMADPDLAQRLIGEPAIAQTLTCAKTAEVTLFSPGVPSADSVLVRSGFLTVEVMERLKELHAVTDIVGHFVDKEGNLVSELLDIRTVGISLDDLRQARQAVAVASGAAKAEPLRVTAKSGFAHVIITDSMSAQHLLAN